MALSYKVLLDYIEPKGITLKSLYRKGVITHYAYTRMLKNEPVSLEHIESICKYLKIPIEQVVEIKYEDESD